MTSGFCSAPISDSRPPFMFCSRHASFCVCFVVLWPDGVMAPLTAAAAAALQEPNPNCTSNLEQTTTAAKSPHRPEAELTILHVMTSQA